MELPRINDTRPYTDLPAHVVDIQEAMCWAVHLDDKSVPNVPLLDALSTQDVE